MSGVPKLRHVAVLRSPNRGASPGYHPRDADRRQPGDSQLAVFGNATMWMAVFADTGASLLVVLNGSRLLKRGGTLRQRLAAVDDGQSRTGFLVELRMPWVDPRRSLRSRVVSGPRRTAVSHTVTRPVDTDGTGRRRLSVPSMVRHISEVSHTPGT